MGTLSTRIIHRAARLIRAQGALTQYKALNYAERDELMQYLAN